MLTLKNATKNVFIYEHSFHSSATPSVHQLVDVTVFKSQESKQAIDIYDGSPLSRSEMPINRWWNVSILDNQLGGASSSEAPRGTLNVVKLQTSTRTRSEDVGSLGNEGLLLKGEEIFAKRFVFGDFSVRYETNVITCFKRQKAFSARGRCY
ncbi:hypothetical protein TNIN_116421 [Trichonephila inaurata madagascariensis]|uniref:Uncharacterized protein n=1 Tax=Trichonephila inaurata madagascariensis TaxID=2747483 RepID=A0A8X6YEH7_9ARAC|nr:hypothetical protein TNIN_116421 [Trichonephila inaurata madagascariensis]